MTFDDRDYTLDSIIKQLSLIELHGKDGSATDAGCMCIETKHLFMLEGLSEEGEGFALSEKEKRFYSKLADFARSTRKKIEQEEWNLNGVMEKKHPVALHNPNGRRFLPHGLTACERKHPSVRHKLSSCIKELEPLEHSGKIGSAVAVCRASIKCPP